MRQEFRIKEMPEPIGHYTDAVRFGNLLFTTAVPPVDAKGNLIGGDDIVAQTRQVLVNLKAILDAAGAEFDDILKISIFMTDPGEAPKIGAIRKEFFGKGRPASTLIGVTRFAVPGMKIEIEAVVGLKKVERPLHQLRPE